jgi:hypothetical protein
VVAAATEAAGLSPLQRLLYFWAFDGGLTLSCVASKADRTRTRAKRNSVPRFRRFCHHLVCYPAKKPAAMLQAHPAYTSCQPLDRHL